MRESLGFDRWLFLTLVQTEVVGGFLSNREIQKPNSIQSNKLAFLFPLPLLLEIDAKVRRTVALRKKKSVLLVPKAMTLMPRNQCPGLGSTAKCLLRSCGLRYLSTTCRLAYSALVGPMWACLSTHRSSACLLKPSVPSPQTQNWGPVSSAPSLGLAQRCSRK